MMKVIVLLCGILMVGCDYSTVCEARVWKVGDGRSECTNAYADVKSINGEVYGVCTCGKRYARHLQHTNCGEMNTIVNPLHRYYREEHLAHVVEEMKRRGPPIIKAYFDGEIWHAREGTHRLRACVKLGCSPILVPVKWPKSRAALERAKLAARRVGHVFDRIVISCSVEWWLFQAGISLEGAMNDLAHRAG